MAFVPAPNIVMCEIRASKAGQLVENRFHIDVLHQPVPGDLSALAGLLVPNIVAGFLPNLPTDVTLTEFHQRSLHTQNDIELTTPFPAGSTGTMSGEPLPNNCSYCVSLRSTSVGRSARGRLYWLGLSADQVVTNNVDATHRTAITAAVESLRAQIAAASSVMVIVSYRQNNAPRVGGPVYFVVSTVLTVDDVVDSQRRRLPGRGA